MEVDPYDAWYCKQLEVNEVPYRAKNWDFFTIDHDDANTALINEKDLSAGDLDHWLDTQQRLDAPGVNILFARHKNCVIRKVPSPCSPLLPGPFTKLIKALRLNSQYFHIRGTGGAHSCALASHSYKHPNGSISGTSFTVRMGFANTRACGSVWAASFAWNARTGRNTAFIEGFSREDLDEFKFLLNSNSGSLGHPLVLPEILLHMITVRLNDRFRVPYEEAFYRQEERTGLSSLPSIANKEWSLGVDEFKDITGFANQALTKMMFMTRRFRLLVWYSHRLHSLLSELGSSTFENERIAPMLEQSYHQWSQRILNRTEILQSYEHQTECMQKRIDNLKNRLETVLSHMNNQKQSQIATINLAIARAVRSDSIPMRTIAYVTLALLPSGLVSSIFGTNFFQYDAGSGTVQVAKTFWQYWAVTIPVTLLVIATWNVWNYREKKKDVGREKEISL